MQPTSLRAHVLASFSLFTAAVAQDAASVKPSAVTPPRQGAPAVPDAALEGLPAFLLPVPGGAVEMGLDWEQFVDAACQVIFPDKPKEAVKRSAEQLKDAMRRSASTLGRRTVDVEPYFLARYPTKNKEYEVYVRLMRSLGKDQRAPLHWWKDGCPDDYLAKLPEVNKEFPKDPDSVVHYWERHGHELPYKVADEKGRSTGDLAVTYVSWRDANAFAAWLGMRLPAEAELTRAMRGEVSHVWPASTGQDAGKDVFTTKLLELLQMNTSRNRALKPIGSVPAAIGPYGHLDMYGQVWQLVGALGFGPINGKDAFADDWKRLQKDKIGSLVTAPPTWASDKVIAKGGSYLSWQEPIQLLIDARAPLYPYEVLESVGFRLAKSMKPGYDVLFSLLRGNFSRAAFAEGQEVDLTAQTGAERYEFGADGFPTAYDAVSFAPVNWLAPDKNVDLNKLLDGCQVNPMLIGALATSAPLLEPVLPAGAYSVRFRLKGTPKELNDAIKQGHKEVIAALKQKAKAGDEEAKPDDKGKTDDKGKADDKAKKNSWREVISRFGLTEKDVEAKDCADGSIGFVRIDELEIPTDVDTFLLCNEGKVVAVSRGTNNKTVGGNTFPSEFTITPSAGVKGKEGKAVAAFHVAVPLQALNNRKFVDFRMHVTLDRAAPTADKPWRLPK